MTASAVGLLSETPAGRLWIGNFNDQDAAKLLLNSIRMAPVDEVRAMMYRELLEGTVVLESPALVMPVRNIQEDVSPLKGQAAAHRLHPTAYITFNPGQDLSITPGSEGWVGNLIRDLVGSKPLPNAAWIHPQATLDELRNWKCRTIVFVDDNSGSGRQILDFVRSFSQHPTIRSWRSLGWLRMRLLVFAASQVAFDRLTASRLFDSVVRIESAPTFTTANFSGSELARVRQLCDVYSQVPGYALGYKDSEGLFLTSSSVPNNLPAITWQEKGPGTKVWHPLFPSRTVPPAISELIRAQDPELDISRLFGDARQPRMARTFEVRPEILSRGAIPVLVLLARRPGMTEDDIAAALRVNLPEGAAILSRLRRLSLVDGDGGVTVAGWAEIAAAKRRPRRTADVLHGSSAPYFPAMLR